MSELQARARAAMDRPAAERPAFDLKGTVASLTVLRLRTADVAWIERDLRGRVEKMPELFQDAPVVLDGSTLHEDVEIALLVGLLRRARLQPVALVGGSPQHQDEARRAGLGLLAPNALRNRSDRAATVPAVAQGSTVGPSPTLPPPIPTAARVASPPPIPAYAAPRQPGFRELRTNPGEELTHPAVAIPEAPTGSMTITQPVRGGQVIYAQRGDLVILAAVNAGAQVIADGNIHVYGALRGRALAGAKGNAEARIFCRSLDAELISIRGEYMLFDEIPADRRGKPCQISHEGGQFKIVPV